MNGIPNFRLVAVGESLLVFAYEEGATTLSSVPLTLEEIRWSQAAPGDGWSSFAWPYVWEDWVVVGTGTGDFAALRLADGERAWEGKVQGRIAGIAGDETSLYLGTTGGTLYGCALPENAR